MEKVGEWFLPISIESEANKTDHWTKKRQRRLVKQRWVALAFQNQPVDYLEKCHVNLIRMSPRFYDFDNLVAAFKSIRDEVANQLRPGKAPGQADNDRNITWGYEQIKSKQKMIKIEIYSN
jgi:hypothetical protein